MLYDPVVFENLKVALENQLYDLDNLDQRIVITSRTDILDMAVMSRRWSLGFMLPDREQSCAVKAEIILSTSIEDLSDELLERSGTNPACSLILKFTGSVEQPTVDCPQIDRVIEEAWNRDLIPVQRLTATFGDHAYPIEGAELWVPRYYENEILLPFNRRINEDQMEDLESLIEHTIRTLEALDKIML